MTTINNSISKCIVWNIHFEISNNQMKLNYKQRDIY
jgi:hypothetical protein